MKIILAILACFLYVSDIKASNIRMYGKDKYGYEQPIYIEDYKEKDTRKVFKITVLADSDNFPLSSYKQGSVFDKIFLDMEQAVYVQISFKYCNEDYQECIDNFERGNRAYLDDIKARFAVSYEEYPYSKNSYIYPAFFENKIHLIMAENNKLSFHGKENLKNYKGVYVKTDKLPKYVLKDFNSLGIKETPNYDEAFKLLLTGKIDYIAASYYSSIIETYKKGVRNFIVYSKEPVWKISLFLRGLPSLMQDERLNNLKKYLKSARYKKIRDEAFEELIEIYEKNTQGVLPPKYIGYTSTEENNEMDDTE